LTTSVLAIDTAMAACSAAVWQGGVLAHRFEPMQRGHAERLAPMVDEVMREAGLGFAAIDRIAVTIGPGTFTGLRIGLAMARGFGLALDRPVIGVTTVETIAAAQTSREHPIVVACDARRDECYFAVFAPHLAPLHAVSVLPLDEIIRRLPDGRAYVLGSASDALIAASRRDDLIRVRNDLPDAAHLAPLAATRAVTDRPPEPLYLRPPDAKPQAGAANGLVIRNARAEEATTIATLHAACFETPWDAAAIAALMATPGTLAWLAETQGEAAGFALTRQAAEEIEILSLGTRPAARRQGIARRIADALDRANAGTMFIEVAADNDAARSLYRSCGFIEAGRRGGYYARNDGTRQDAVIMRKERRP
jgi:tRNA threonylcarbamoyladenosine biosynthesis protein TsaB